MTHRSPERLFCHLFAIVCFVVFPVILAGQDKDWRPIAPQELSASTAVVEQGADAEALFWEVRVDDSQADQLSLRHYVRIKIFTERGREDFARHDVAFTKGTKIRDLEARVTTPSGAVSYVKKEDVLERDVLKVSGFKVRAKTVAFPSLEVGSIIEYKYREVIEDGSANMRLVFQREIPIRNISYFVKPFSGTMGMAYQPFNVGNTKFEKEKDGFFRATMLNVPAFREEPSMLPEDEVKSWIYIYYVREYPKNPDDYWKTISKNAFEAAKSSFKPSAEVKQATDTLLAGATTDDEKLRRIYQFTKTEIKNTTYAENVTEEDRKKVRSAKSASDTLKLKMASAGDVDQLFGAMARAAGFDARIAFSGSRNELFFDRKIPIVRLMLNSSSVAVKVGEDWRFFSPASYFVPYGMMSWIEEDQLALISDPKELIWKQIPLSAADRSMEKRTGKFTLQPDGTLVGEGRIEYTGHRAFAQKMSSREDSPAERETTLKNILRSTILGTTEIESFTIENVNDPEKPFVYTFKVKVPGYASRTGRRLFFQPNILKRSAQPRFTANARKYDVYISYPYSEVDEFTIDLPAGFSLEAGEVPAPIKDPQGIGSHETNITVENQGRLLRYKRNFSFGNGGFLRFPAQSYSAVKNLFELFNRADVHQLTLRDGSAGGTNNE